MASGRMIDAGSVMDPGQQADHAVALNLKLMRWRAAPELQLDRLAECRCLLLGALRQLWGSLHAASCRDEVVCVWQTSYCCSFK